MFAYPSPEHGHLTIIVLMHFADEAANLLVIIVVKNMVNSKRSLTCIHAAVQHDTRSDFEPQHCRRFGQVPPLRFGTYEKKFQVEQRILECKSGNFVKPKG